jgi:hypothetical protein
MPPPRLHPPAIAPRLLHPLPRARPGVPVPCPPPRIAETTAISASAAAPCHQRNVPAVIVAQHRQFVCVAPPHSPDTNAMPRTRPLPNPLRSAPPLLALPSPFPARSLDLSYNAFSGPLPNDIARLTFPRPIPNDIARLAFPCALPRPLLQRLLRPAPRRHHTPRLHNDGTRRMKEHQERVRPEAYR